MVQLSQLRDKNYKRKQIYTDLALMHYAIEDVAD